ncbi:hypothetical protein F5Y04DRAFT_285613 [Hypomontagnella monticulosa]|nr:hypothetical protein F5Y04DRAFT_285613 [Hypomontagnella monticulosa]
MASRLFIVVSIIVVLYAAIHRALTIGIPTRRDVKFAPKSDYGLVLANLPNPLIAGPGVDIIFAHGLGSNPDTSWQAHNQSYACDRNPGAETDACGAFAGRKHVNWITDLLYDDLPPHLKKSTRIFFYNYDSYWSRDGIEERRARLGQELFEHLADLSTQDQDRIFVLVGHSYGGLVIKEAILSAHAYEKYRPTNIYRQIRAVIFLGTPHRGSEAAKYAAKLARGFQFFGLDPNFDIVNAIGYDSPELRDMHRRFEAVSQDLLGVNFYEILKLRQLYGVYYDYAVNEASATLDRPTWRNLPLYTDHVGLNKYWRKDSNYKRVSGQLISLIDAVVKEERSVTSVCVMPPRLAKEYVEREKLSSKLERNLEGPGNIVALVGIGGVGKTQLALRYAERHKSRYENILWIDAGSVETVVSSFQKSAQALGLPSQNSDPVFEVLRWLDQRGKRYGETLLIFDNMDSVSARIIESIPRTLHGSLIVTSRNTQCVTLLPENSHIIHVADMTPSEAQALLYRHLKLSATNASKIIQDLSEQISKAMHYTPLAVHLAGAQIRSAVIRGLQTQTLETEIQLQRFLEDFQSHKDDIFKVDLFKGIYTYDWTVDTVLDSSLKIIDEIFPHYNSRQLLNFLAHFNICGIPDEVLQAVAKDVSGGEDYIAWQLPRWLRDLFPVDATGTWDDFHFRQALEPLLRYGLVEFGRTNDFVVIYIHPLVRWKASQKDEKSTDTLSWDVVHAMFYACAIRQIYSGEDTNRKSAWASIHIGRYAPAPKVFLSAPIDIMDPVLDMIADQYEINDRVNDSHDLFETLLKADAEQLFGANSNRLYETIQKGQIGQLAILKSFLPMIARLMNNVVLLALAESKVQLAIQPLLNLLLNVGIENFPLSQLSYSALRILATSSPTWSWTTDTELEQIFRALTERSFLSYGAEDVRHYMDLEMLAMTYLNHGKWNEAKIVVQEMEIYHERIFLEGWDKMCQSPFWKRFLSCNNSLTWPVCMDPVNWRLHRKRRGTIA